MLIQDIEAAVKDARQTQRVVDSQTGALANLIKGRLRTIESNYWNVETLRTLKRELAGFDSKRGVWKV